MLIARDGLDVAVVDASVVVDWVAPAVDPRGPARRLLTRFADGETEVIGPRLLLEEVANALITGIRVERWGGTEADHAFARLRQLPVRLLDTPADLDRAWDLSRRYDGHPVHDMVYVALAERLGQQLFTADDALRSKLSLVDFVVVP